MNAMRYTKSEATELWKRIRRDTADEHMQVNKVKCAEERRVKWTTYQNLDLWFMRQLNTTIMERSVKKKRSNCII